MASKGLCCGMYRGEIFLRDLSNPNAGLMPIGNATATLNQSMNHIGTPDYTSLGGEACSIDLIDSITLNLEVHCTKPENLAKAFLGESVQLTNGHASESYDVHEEGELIAFNKLPILNTITVKKNNADLTQGIDYEAVGSGIKILTQDHIGEEIDIEYDYGNNWIIDAHTLTQKSYELVLNGRNVASDKGEAYRVRIWKVKFSPTDSFDLISKDNFAQVNLNGQLSKDDTKIGTSKWFQVEMQQPSDSQY